LLTFNCKVEDFGILAKDKELDLIFIYELLAQPFIKNKKRIWGTRKLSTKFAKVIVPEESASLIGFKKSAMNATHTQMNEFNDVNDPNYQRVSLHILDVVKRAPGTLARRSKEVARGEHFLSIPHSRLKTFVGREELLSQIEDRMAWDDDKYQARVALCGPAGVGKTQLAVEYAYRTPERHALSGIYWVSGASAGKFKESYLRIGRKAKITTDDSKGNLDIIKEWLEDHKNGRWLMIVDNVDDLDLLQDDVSQTQCEGLDNESECSLLVKYIPNCSHGSILYTSRDRSACIDLAGPNSRVQVDQLSTHECQLLVENSLQACQYEDGGIDDLILALEGLPLALAHALSYIEKVGISVNQYMDLFRKSDSSRIRLLSGVSGGHAGQVLPRSVAATWMISFNQIKRKQPLAANLLGLMSLVDRHFIPAELLPVPRNVINKLNNSKTADVTEIEILEAVGVLEGFSMITKCSGIGFSGTCWTMHALVQISMQIWLQENDEYHYHVISVLQHLVSVVFLGDPALYGPYLPHAFTVLNHVACIEHHNLSSEELTPDNRHAASIVPHTIMIKKLKASEVRMEVQLRQKIAEYYWSDYQFWLAEPFLDVALVSANNIFDPEDDTTISLMCDLSSVYLFQDRSEEALNLQLEALDRLERSDQTLYLSDDTLSKFSTQLALTYKAVGWHSEAEEAWHALIAEHTKRGERSHVDLLLAKANLASCYLDQGRLDESQTLFDQVLEGLCLELPATSIILQGFKLDLVHCYFDQGNHGKAEELYEAVFKEEIGMGERHPRLLRTMGQAAQLHLKDANLSEAQDFMELAITICQNAYGHGNILTLKTKLEYVAVLEKKETSKVAPRAAVRVLKSVLGHGKDVLPAEVIENTMYRLAKFLVKDCKPDDARAYMRQFIETRGKRLNQDDPQVVAAIEELSGWTNLPSHFGIDEETYKFLFLMRQIFCT